LPNELINRPFILPDPRAACHCWIFLAVLNSVDIFRSDKDALSKKPLPEFGALRRFSNTANTSIIKWLLSTVEARP